MNEKLKKCLQKIYQIDQGILDLLYPPRCPFCDKAVLSKEGVCKECRKKIHKIKGPVCMKCGKPLSNPRKEYCFDCERKTFAYSQGKALWVYEKEVKASIYRFKYQNKREYGKVYASEMAEYFEPWIRRKKIQVVIPVPLHKKRKKKRGYNQTEILAKEIGRILDLPVYTDVLIRMRNTKPQKMLNDTERKNNLKGAFKTIENIVQLKYILLVDDIYTTGSTVNAAAEALKEAGAAEVYTFCVSIGKDD